MAKEPISLLSFQLSDSEKVYFASDFHLGVPDQESSLQREKKIIRWLDDISKDAKAIFLLGDIFDFWFEYKHTIPKGFIRFQGKLAELRDKEIPIYLFTGNHDLWMFDYFTKELEIPVYRKPLSIVINEKKLLIGHGDGLGPGDYSYKFFKVFFNNRFCQWAFGWIHPTIGIGLAQFWSKSSRKSMEAKEDFSKEKNEPILRYCKKIEANNHHDFYIFGHRHLPLELAVSGNSTYFSLGDWVNHCTYLEIDEKESHLKTYSL